MSCNHLISSVFEHVTYSLDYVVSSFSFWFFMFHRYNALLAKRPLLTNMLTSGFLFGTGDVIAQNAFPDTGFDPYRTLRSTAYGALVFAPIGDKWYRLIASFGKPNSIAAHAGRVAADQLVFAPLVAIPMYFTVMSIMEGKSASEVIEKTRKSWLSTTIDNWKVWPAFQCVNFWFVPVGYRLLCGNVFALGWNTWLSRKQHNQKK